MLLIIMRFQVQWVRDLASKAIDFVFDFESNPTRDVKIEIVLLDA